jgi:hypothetical protein
MLGENTAFTIKACHLQVRNQLTTCHDLFRRLWHNNGPDDASCHSQNPVTCLLVRVQSIAGWHAERCRLRRRLTLRNIRFCLIRLDCNHRNWVDDIRKRCAGKFFCLSGQEAQGSSYNLVLSGFRYPKTTGNLVKPTFSRHLSLLESPPDRGTKYSITVISRDNRHFIGMPMTWVQHRTRFTRFGFPVGSTRRRYSAA